MKQLLAFLVQQEYSAQIKGKSWFSLLRYMENMESTGRHFQVSYEVAFTVEAVKSVEVFSDNTCIITLIH
jgi:hypothetical protein